MFSSLIGLVDSVLTLDEGYSRKDLVSGDQITIEGNFNRDVAGRISGAATLACVRNTKEGSKKYHIIVGKHKLELSGCMDMSPKPLSMVNSGSKIIRITDDQNKYFEVRFNSESSYNVWLTALGEALAESICTDVLSAQDMTNSVICSNMRRCIQTCELLTSPSKPYIHRVSEIYGVRRKLLEIMSTLRSNPCDVSIKDLRNLKELCRKYPEMHSDPDMKFLLERMPSDRYNSDDLQVILKDILCAEADGEAGMVCAQVYHGTGMPVDAYNSTSAEASAVMAEECDQYPPSNFSSIICRQKRDVSEVSCKSVSNENVAVPTAAEQGARVSVPVHRKSRIVLNGVEIQSSTRSPSSAGKALSKQIKIKSKFTTPTRRREVTKTAKTKSPLPDRTILSDIKYTTTPRLQLQVLASSLEILDKERISVSALDKENVPINVGTTPKPVNMKTPINALETPIAPILPDAALVLSELSTVSNIQVIESSAEDSCSPPFDQQEFINLIPNAPDPTLYGSVVKSTTFLPFVSPPKQCYAAADMATLFEDAKVYAVSAPPDTLPVLIHHNDRNCAPKSPMRSSSPVKAACGPVLPHHASKFECSSPSPVKACVQDVHPSTHLPGDELSCSAAQLAKMPLREKQSESVSFVSSSELNRSITAPTPPPPAVVLSELQCTAQASERAAHPLFFSPVRSLRAKHLAAADSTVVGEMPAAVAPRTPAPVARCIVSPIPVPPRTAPPVLTPVPVPLLAVEEPQNTTEKRVTLPTELSSVNFGRRVTLLVLFVMMCAVGTMRTMYISTVPVPTLATSSTVRLSTAEIEDSPMIAVPKTFVDSRISDSSAAAIEIPVLMPAPALTNFEMRVRFEEQSPPSSSPSQLLHRALQPHTSATAFQVYLRRLHRLLTVPVKILRTIYSSALMKFDRIRKVLAA